MLLESLYQLLYCDGGHRQYLYGALAAQLDAHPEDRVVVRSLGEVHEVIGAQDGVLLWRLDAVCLDLLIDLPYAPGLLLQRPPALWCQRG